MAGLDAKPICKHSQRFRDELAFRDALRADPELAAGYATLKRRLAAEFEHDREAYTAAKAPFVQATLHRVRSGRIRAYDADARDR